MEENPYAETQDFADQFAKKRERINLPGEKIHEEEVREQRKSDRELERQQDKIHGDQLKRVDKLRSQQEKIRNKRHEIDRKGHGKTDEDYEHMNLLWEQERKIERALESIFKLWDSRYTPDPMYRDSSITDRLLKKYSDTDAELLKRYPEASMEHKCPAVVDGWSSIEDCLSDCPYKKSMDEDDYWRDMDWEREQRTPPTREEILSKLPSGKHTKHLRDSIMMPDDEWDRELLEQQDERDLMKMSPKDRKHY